ncbi:MAG TPA: GNAT family N-acetyltransferase [Prolixibacteraceae bacterium]|jgi:ribosomal protein S18 acetylase RimI-like enzyme
MIQNDKIQEFKTKGFRKTVVPSDIMSVTQILKSTGFFKPHEIDVAIELVEDRLKNGVGCGYQFYFLEIEGRTVAYGCYGEIPCTIKNYDLYWLAVDNNFRNKGLGSLLLEKIEDDIKAHAGRGIYIETSNKEQYTPTITFYEKCNYQQVAVYKDFYDIDDNKAVYYKKL